MSAPCTHESSRHSLRYSSSSAERPPQAGLDAGLLAKPTDIQKHLVTLRIHVLSMDAQHTSRTRICDMVSCISRREVSARTRRLPLGSQALILGLAKRRSGSFPDCRPLDEHAAKVCTATCWLHGPMV